MRFALPCGRPRLHLSLLLRSQLAAAANQQRQRTGHPAVPLGPPGSYIDELVQIAINGDPVDDPDFDPEDPDHDPRKYYAQHDANFNVISLVDDTGAMVERYEYTPYGQRTVYFSPGPNDDTCHAATTISRRITASGTLQPYGLNPIGFQGLIHDEHTRHIYMRHRMYDPYFARLNQRDPKGYVDGMNLGLPFRSNPINRVDPFGLSTEQAVASSWWWEDLYWAVTGDRSTVRNLSAQHEFNQAVEHQAHRVKTNTRNAQVAIEKFGSESGSSALAHVTGVASHTLGGVGSTAAAFSDLQGTATGIEHGVADKIETTKQLAANEGAAVAAADLVGLLNMAEAVYGVDCETQCRIDDPLSHFGEGLETAGSLIGAPATAARRVASTANRFRRTGRLAPNGSETPKVSEGALPNRQSPPAACAETATELAQRLGREGEAAANIAKNTERIESVSGRAAYRIPDELTETTLTEVKNVIYQHFSTQLQDSLHYAIMKNKQMILKVRPDTILAKPLKRAIDAGWIDLEYIE